MTKSEVVRIFGSQAEFARAVSRTRARISQLPEELPQQYVDMAIGAAVRLGKPVPAEMLIKRQEQA